jgi:hypothetical protein
MPDEIAAILLSVPTVTHKLYLHNVNIARNFRMCAWLTSASLSDLRGSSQRPQRFKISSPLSYLFTLQFPLYFFAPIRYRMPIHISSLTIRES